MKKIYTRTGDKGTTSLFGGDRVGKQHPRIAAYGTVDETNAYLGMARAHLSGAGSSLEDQDQLASVLRRLQEELFVLGADLATPTDARPAVPRIQAAHVERLERDIDRLQEVLPPLRHFILPGGTSGAAALHVARTVCRRAERRALEAHRDTSLNEQALIYLNRLSDLLFVLARAANRQAGVKEPTWSPDT